MSAYFATASTSNYLQYDAGSDTDFSYPFTIACWVKHPANTSAQTALTFADYNAGAASLRYSALYAGYTSATRRYGMEHRSETFQSYESGSGVNPPADTWYAMVLVCTNATTRTLYWGTSSGAYSSANDDTGDAGTSLSIRYATIGAQWRAAASITRPWAGYVARAARWTVALSAGEIESYLDGTEPSSIQSGSLWGYWKLDGSSLADGSGNGRSLTEVGTVGDSTDEPFTAATKYVKLLTESAAASATGVEVVVHSAPSGSNYVTGTTRYGSATGQEFEAALESGQAVLKVLASDVGCSALDADTVVSACARNTTYTTGMVSATIIEE